MPTSTHIENPDVILIGSGVMSAHLGALLKRLDPRLRIQLYEVTDGLAQESSDGGNNAGTGHAGICELSYTPKREADGSVNVNKVIEIFEQFEHSKQFWSYAVASGMADAPKEFINPVQHISFVHGAEQVDFLKARHAGMAAHHFFKEMSSCSKTSAQNPSKAAKTLKIYNGVLSATEVSSLFTTNIIPEPPSAALLGICGGLALLRRRR